MKKIRIWERRILGIERTREGYATWGNSDLDLSCKPIFAWSQDLCFYYYFSHSFQGPLSSELWDWESSKLHEATVVFLLFPFPVISPAGPIPYYCAISAPWPCRSTCLSFAEVPGGRNGDMLQNVCCPLPWGHTRLAGLCPRLLLSSVVALPLCT